MNPSQLIGQTFYGCTLLRVLGRGATGVVYQAHQLSLDRPVALKILSSAAQTEGLKTLLAEARALARISHPNVLKVYEVGSEKGTSFIIMEYLEGETLHDRLARAHKLPVEAVLKLSAEVANGLCAAHRAKIVHRDLKPANVFLRPSSSLKLIDFGLASLGPENPTETGGTPEYMAPEQWNFETVDGRTDLYALGIMMYTMTTGHHPFHANTIPELKQAHLSTPLPLPRTHSHRIATLFAIIEKLAQKNPADRYLDATGVLEDIDRLRSGERPHAAEAYGAPLVCGVCDTRNSAGAERCRACEADLSALEAKLEDLLPDTPTPMPPPVAPLPKQIRRMRRRH